MPALAAHPFERGNRAIAIAVVLSLALHAALLLILPALREAQQRRSDSSDPILARLTQPTPAPVASPAAEAALPVLPPITPRPIAAPSAKHPPQLRPTLEDAPIALPDARAESEATAKDAIAPNADAPIGPAALPQVATRPPPPAADAPDAGTLAQYRLALISAAKRFKRYPRVALDNDWQGKVEVRIVIDTTGAISALSVRSSAGHPLLDRQALEMIERAKEMALIPPALRGREFSVDIPVVFSLREPDA